VTPMTGAERTARYRERKRREKAERAGSGVQADGSWVPEFAAQRPPFTPGNEAALIHGARSPAKIGPLAAEIRAELLTHPECPAYLRDPGWRYTLESWSEARAELVLLRAWRDRMTTEESATELVLTDETEDRPTPGRAKKRGRSQRIESVLAMIDRAERRAERLGAKLGLDPLSRARLGKDVSAARDDLAVLLAERYEAVREQRAVTGGGTEAAALPGGTPERNPVPTVALSRPSLPDPSRG
jgi:hypothetical protein